MEHNQKSNEIQVELTEDIAQGTYANLVVIAHSVSEFVLDFIRVLPGQPKAKVLSRVILAPEQAKRMLYALQDNIRKFEEQQASGAKAVPFDLIPPFGNMGEA